MKLDGEVTLPYGAEETWKRINDPVVLKACIPGCEELERKGENSFSAIVKVKIGPVSAKFKGNVELADLRHPTSLRLVGAGEGGVAGFAKGGADVTLTEIPEGCKLSYAAEANVGGKIAQMGTRLLDGVARKLADQFFQNLAKYEA